MEIKCIHIQAPFAQWTLSTLTFLTDKDLGFKVLEVYLTKPWKQWTGLWLNIPANEWSNKVYKQQIKAGKALSLLSIWRQGCKLLAEAGTVWWMHLSSQRHSAFSLVIFNNSELLAPDSFSQGRKWVNYQELLQGGSFYSGECNKKACEECNAQEKLRKCKI